jgi:hypothetical protein
MNATYSTGRRRRTRPSRPSASSARASPPVPAPQLQPPLPEPLPASGAPPEDPVDEPARDELAAGELLETPPEALTEEPFVELLNRLLDAPPDEALALTETPEEDPELVPPLLPPRGWHTAHGLPSPQQASSWVLGLWMQVRPLQQLPGLPVQ